MAKKIVLVLLVALSACSKSPTEPVACATLSGTYDVTYTGLHCPTNVYLPTWDLEQSGCSFQTRVAPDLPTVSGTVQGSTVRLTLRNGFTNCTYQLEGNGQLDGRTLRATVTGNVNGPCCANSESLQIVAVRR